MIGAWLGWCTLVWLWIHAAFARWGRGQRLEPGARTDASVRVCVPARDEALNIGTCVRALTDDPSFTEIVVLDDGSSDGTAALAIAAADGDPRFTTRSADSRPEGWAGKPWACAEAARDATSDWLLFVDADVRVATGAIAAAIARAHAENADLVSLFGTWELVSFAERLVIPAMGWLIRSANDLPALNADGGRPFANGQFILVRRSAYDRLGGHGAVRAEVLDDVRLAERARDAGLRIRLWWAPWAFRVRLYRSIADIVAGYRKNLYEGLGRRAWLGWLGAIAVFATTAAPALGLVAFIAAGDLFHAVWAAAIVVAEIALRARIEVRDGRAPWIAVFHPIAGALLAAIFLVSTVSPRVSWKGRAFQSGQSVD